MVDALDRAEPDPAPEPALEELTVGVAAEPAVAVEGVDCVADCVEGNCSAPCGVARPVPLAPEVWAAAAPVTATQRNKTI